MTGYLGMVRQWQTMFYNNRLTAWNWMPGRGETGRAPTN